MTEFKPIYQNNFINELARLNYLIKMDMFGNPELQGGNFSFSLSSPTFSWNAACARVFDTLLLRAAEGNIYNPFVTTREYALFCDVGADTAKRQLKKFCNIINGIAIGECDSFRGGISMEFSMEFIETIQGTNGNRVMPFPLDLLKIDLHGNPNAYQYGRYITLQKFMNLGKRNENLVCIRSLVGNIGYNSTYGGFNRIIKTPFIRDINALNDIFSWDWVGVPPNSWQEFKRATIKIDWHNYPYDWELTKNRLKTKKGKGKKSVA